MCLTSTTQSRERRPSRTCTIRSVPPARTRARSPFSASRATASATVFGAAYSNAITGGNSYSSVAELHGDVLGLQIRLDPFVAQLAAHAALLHAAEGALRRR